MTQRQIDERKPYNHSELWTPRELVKGDIKQIIGLVLGLGIVFFLGYLYKAWVIEDYIETTAVFVKMGRYGKRFKFTNSEGNIIEASTKFNQKLDIGDTVWIKYSTFDEDVIEVIDKNYKKHLKK